MDNNTNNHDQDKNPTPHDNNHRIGKDSEETKFDNLKNPKKSPNSADTNSE